MTRTTLFTAFVAALILFLYSGKAQAVYSWVDEQGQTHITDYPGPDNSAQYEPAETQADDDSAALSSGIMPAPVQAQPAGEVATPPAAEPASASASAKTVKPVPPLPSPRLRTAAVPSPAASTAVVQTPSVSEVSPKTPAKIPVGSAGQNRAIQNRTAQRLIKAFMGTFLLASMAGYLYFSLCLYLIAKKLGVSAAWVAWIPLFQVVTMLEAASRPMWWIILLFVPFVNLFIQIYIWMCISENSGRNQWLGLLMLVPVVNLIYLGVLAFSRQVMDGSEFDVAMS